MIKIQVEKKSIIIMHGGRQFCVKCAKKQKTG